MPSRKITEVKQELANVEKEQRSDHQHTEIWWIRSLSSHVLVEACLSREGPTWTTWISGSFLNDTDSKRDSIEVWRPGEGQPHMGR